MAQMLLPLGSALVGKGVEYALLKAKQMSEDEVRELVKTAIREVQSALSPARSPPDTLKTEEGRRLYSQVFAAIAASFKQIDELVMENPYRALWSMFTLPLAVALDLTRDFWGAMFDFLQALIAPPEKATYESAKKAIDYFLAFTGDLNAIAGFIATLGDIELLGCKLPGKVAARMVTNFAWTFGLGWLSWIALGPMVRHAIADPVDKYYRRATRTEDMPRSEWEEAWRRQMIDDTQLRDA